MAEYRLVLFLGILFYDRVIISKNLDHSDFALFFNENYLHIKIPQIAHFLYIVYLLTIIHKNKISVEKQLKGQIAKFYHEYNS